VIGNRELGKEI